MNAVRSVFAAIFEADGGPPARPDTTTDSLGRHYDRTTSRYNRQIKLFERILLGDGRPWVSSQATSDGLEIAVGTGRNIRTTRTASG